MGRPIEIANGARGFADFAQCGCLTTDGAGFDLLFAIGLAGLNGSELARSLGNKGGGMPFSLALDRRGQIVWRKLGVTTRAELDALAQRVKSKG